MHDLVDLDCNILFQSQPIPLVIDSDNLTLESLTGSVAIFPEQTTIDSPFEVHRIGGFDSNCIFSDEGHPFIPNFDLCSGDIEDHALVVSFLEVDCSVRSDRGRS